MKPRVPGTPRTRTIALVVVAVLVALGGFIALRLLQNGGGLEGETPALRVVAMIRVPEGASPLAATDDAVWIVGGPSGDGRRRTLYRIDPGTNRIVARVKVGLVPEAIAIVDDAVWVANGTGAGLLYSCNAGIPCPGPRFPKENSLQKIDLATNRSQSPVPLEAPMDAVFAEGSLWATIPDELGSTVLRLDPQSGRTLSSTPLAGDGAVHMAVGSGAVWVATSDVGGGRVGRWNIYRMDPQSGRVVATIEVRRGGPEDAAAGAGAAWIASPSVGGMLRVDARTNRVVGEPLPPTTASALAVGLGAVWATDGEDGLFMIDPQTNRVMATLRGLGPSYDVAVGDGAVWVSTRHGLARIELV